MNRVLDRLWIGATEDLAGTIPLRALGFSAVVDLRDGIPTLPAMRGVELLRVANRDGDPWGKDQVAAALDFIHSHIREGRVLVACAAGMSRSASMVIGYLQRCGHSAPEAFVLLKAARSAIAPVPAMLESVMPMPAAQQTFGSER